MNRRAAWILTLSACWSGCLAGCGSGAEEVSNSEYLLGLLRAKWQAVRSDLPGSQPDLNVFRSIHDLLSRRVSQRIEKDYNAANKQQVLAKLEALRQGYEAGISARLDYQSPAVRLRSGATLDQIRKAFAELDVQYVEIERLLDSR